MAFKMSGFNKPEQPSSGGNSAFPLFGSRKRKRREARRRKKERMRKFDDLFAERMDINESEGSHLDTSASLQKMKMTDTLLPEDDIQNI